MEHLIAPTLVGVIVTLLGLALAVWIGTRNGSEERKPAGLPEEPNQLPAPIKPTPVGHPTPPT
jgi:hypothetical protein